MKSPGLSDRLSDWVNPIVVKELRQGVNSRFITVVLLGFLLLQVGTIGVFLMTTALQTDAQALIERGAGANVFLFLHAFLVGVCLLFLPLYTGGRFAAERLDSNADFLYITTLRPRSIIAGKYVSALVLALLIFSACTPFLTFTYLLRGVDFVTILLSVAIDFLAVATAVMVFILIGTLPVNRVFKVLFSLAGLAGLFFLGAGVIGGTSALVYSGDAARGRAAFWMITLGLGVLIIIGLGLFFSWSVALISPPSSNRAFGVRRYTVFAWLVSGLVFVGFQYVLPELFAGPFWLCAGVLLFGLGLVVSINEREAWTPRVSRTIPRTWWLRLPAFLMYSGSAGGILFYFLMIAVAFAGSAGWEKVGTRLLGAPTEFPFREAVFDRISQTMEFVALYTVSYCLSAVFVRRLFAARIPAGFTWLVALLLTALGSIVPFVIGFFLFYREWNYPTHFYWLLANPFAAVLESTDPTSPPRQEVFLSFAAVWAVAALLINLPWFFRQARAFRPFGGTPSADWKVKAAVAPSIPGEVTRTLEPD